MSVGRRATTAARTDARRAFAWPASSPPPASRSTTTVGPLTAAFGGEMTVVRKCDGGFRSPPSEATDARFLRTYGLSA